MAIKKPGNGRASYAIIIKGKTIYDERIDLLNAEASSLPPDIILSRLKAIERSLKPNPEVTLYTENLLLAKAAYNQDLLAKPHRRGNHTAWRRLVRAVKTMGTLSLKVASFEQVLTKLKNLEGGRRYHAVGGINRMLRQANRDLRIPNSMPRPDQVVYIDMSVFLERLPLISGSSYRDCLASYFATGCRLGELPSALIVGNTAVIEEQVLKTGSLGMTKNGRRRKSPILPPLKIYVDRLFSKGITHVRDLRLNHHKELLHLCKVILGVKIHDLRHSYAVYLAKHGESLANIARWIGDSEAVCEKHYSRFIPSHDEIELAVKRLRGK